MAATTSVVNAVAKTAALNWWRRAQQTARTGEHKCSALDERGVKHACDPVDRPRGRPVGALIPGADPNTAALSKLVHNPDRYLTAYIETDGCITYEDSLRCRTIPNLCFCATNPSLLLAFAKNITGMGSAYVAYGTGDGTHHDWHAEHMACLSPSVKKPVRTAVFTRLVHNISLHTPVKAYVAEQALNIHKTNQHSLKNGWSVEETRQATAGFVDGMKAFNKQGTEARLFKVQHMHLHRITTIPAEDFVASMGAWYAANGGSFLMCDDRRRTCQVGVFLQWSRDAPGAIKKVHDRLGFGTLASDKDHQSPEAGADGDYTRINFRSEANVNKLYDLLAGKEVKLATEAVAATSSGRPRCAGKLLKLHTLMQYAAAHRLPRATTGRPPGVYTMSMYEKKTKKPGWWSEGHNWRHMARALWPGIAIPDHEH